MNLNELGWPAMNLQPPENLDQLARITVVHRSYCRAITIKGEINVYMSGKFHGDIATGLDRPATGDFVKISPPFVDEQNQPAALIEEILPRRSKISRMASGSEGLEQVLASNIDYVFIVTSANEDLSINRLQRYILQTKEGGATPVVVLSKIDLIEDEVSMVEKLQSRLQPTEIISVSSQENLGMDPLVALLQPGTTSVFVGSSGVGKSTLVNSLMGESIQKVLTIREDDDKGRHTTTSRELFFIPQGGMIIDTAGIREIQVLAGEEAVSNTFQHITELMENCRFTDCTHGNEPGCALNEALESGELPRKDYENFLKLQKEAAYAQRKNDKQQASNAKKRWKKIHLDYKARKKFESKN